ncbi:hypothetical protein SteCoe_29646 [Stentor coeruleus]|uniref:Sulfhydryl oxidase n=1 Tax=Stentor coeruleus TaxID=5963 RepID=A0A1R2B5D6_9CILI|nr:hypothetical protein SteCoe_29646 [Stentor coeruleus]
MDCGEDICEEAHIPKTIYKGGNEIPCPPSKQSIGRFGWGLLHTIAAHYPDDPSDDWKDKHQRFIHAFSRTFPCKSCGYHFHQMIKEKPPKLENREQISVWTCEMHNEINAMLNKPVFPCTLESLDLRWRKGKPPCTATINNL